jgi:hypothetical protein
MPLPQQIDPTFKYVGDSPENSIITEIRPLSLSNNSNVLQFLVPKIPDACIDPATGGKYLSTINSQLDSLFSGMSISINGEQILTTGSNHILSFFMKQLNFSSEYRKSVLYSGHYIESAAATEGEPTGSSFQKLATLIKDSAKVRVAGKLPHPFFQSPKFLPPGTELGITLTQTSPEIFLMTDVEDKLKVVINDCWLMVRLVKLEPNLQVAFNEIKSPFIYPFKHTVLKSFTLATGISSFTLHNAFYGNLPSRIFALQIATDAYLGNLTKSPFSFGSNKLTDFNLNYNGINIPLEKCKFEMPGNGELLFEHLNNVLKLNSHQITPSYTYEKFISDGFFLSENLINDVAASSSTQPFVSGSVSVELVLKEALKANVTLLLIGEYTRSHILIEKNGVKLIEQ